MKLILIIPLFVCMSVSNNHHKNQQQGVLDSTIVVNRNSVFTINLPAAIGQGFSWQLSDETLKKNLQYTGQTLTNKSDGKAGSDGIQHFNFKGIKPGKVTVKFIYTQPFIKPHPRDVTTKQYLIIIH
jgi:predicted secreted protein